MIVVIKVKAEILFKNITDSLVDIKLYSNIYVKDKYNKIFLKATFFIKTVIERRGGGLDFLTTCSGPLEANSHV